MKIYHLIPKEEEKAHTASADCVCEPEIVQPYRLAECCLDGEVAYEHHHFGEPVLDDKGNWTSVIKEE